MNNDQNKTGFERFGRYGSLLMFLLLILFLSIFMQPSSAVNFVFEDENESFTIQMASGYTQAIAWDTISSVEVRETLDPGVLIDGTDNKTEQSGIWENDEFGTYSLCTDAKVDRYIVLYTEDGVVVTNFESAEATDSLAEAIEEML